MGLLSTGVAGMLAEFESLSSSSTPSERMRLTSGASDVVAVVTGLLLEARRFLKIPLMNMSSYSGLMRQKPPLPGSSLRRGTFWKHLFRDKLWRIEFCQRNENS